MNDENEIMNEWWIWMNDENGWKWMMTMNEWLKKMSDEDEWIMKINEWWRWMNDELWRWMKDEWMNNEDELMND